MLDVGFSEILLTSAIALIVLGPERLPKVARQVGNWMGRARAMARQLSEQLEREVSAEELLKIQNKPNPNAQLPNSGVAFDPAHTPSIAPPPVTAPAPTIAPEPVVEPASEVSPPSAVAPASAADSPAEAAMIPPVLAPARASTPPPVKVPHPTSAAAMHAADVSPQAELALSDPLSPATDPIHTPHE
jgi:sec-independent protein translocase protein TatB